MLRLRVLFGVSIICISVSSFVLNDDKATAEQQKSLNKSAQSPTELSTVKSESFSQFWDDLYENIESVEEGKNKNN